MGGETLRVFVAALFLFGVCLSIIWLEDVRSFEIKLKLLPVLLALSFFLALHINIAWQCMLLGGLAWTLSAALYQRLRPSALGLGDIRLFGVAGTFFAVQDALLGVALFLFFSALTANGYARARDKRFRRSIYPAAMPTLIAMLCVLEWRLIEHAGNSNAHLILTYAVVALPCIGLLVGAIIYAPLLKDDTQD
jgi:hypothetical protein